MARTAGGKAVSGASRPERNRKGMNSKRSRALAFSLQKHRDAITLCSKNAIANAIQVASQASNNPTGEGIQNA